MHFMMKVPGKNQLKNGDLTKAPEILRLINHQLADSKNNFNNVEIGKFYGELNKRNKTIIHNEKVLHPLQPYDFTATKNQLNFFQLFLKLIILYHRQIKYGTGKNY